MPRLPDRSFTLLGVDPFSESPVRDEVTHRAGRIDLATIPDGAGYGRVAGAARGDPRRRSSDRGSRSSSPGENRSVEVAGIVEVDAARREVAGNFLFADIATAQELTGLAGRITRIDLVLTEAEAAALESLRLPGTLLLDAESQGTAIVEMTRAFRTNLTALSLLALVVGAFLIYATLSLPHSAPATRRGHGPGARPHAGAIVPRRCWRRP